MGKALRGLTVWMTVSAVPMAVGAGGCTCNGSEYGFPDPKNPPPAAAPTSYGNWLSLDVAPMSPTSGARLTMAYYDRDLKGLGYAVGTPQDDGTVAWIHERVDGYPDNTGLDLGDVGKYASQRTMPDGTVWIAYHDNLLGSLKVAHRTHPSEWAVEQIDGGAGEPGVGNWASLAIGGDGQPVVVHCDDNAGAVRLSRYDGTAWQNVQIYASKPVDVTDDAGVVTTLPAGVGYTDLVVTPDGEELVAVYDRPTGDLHLLRGRGASFEDTVVDAEGDVGAWPSLWTDGTTLWIAYQDVGEGHLKFAEGRLDGNLAIEVVDDGRLRGADTAVYPRGGEPNIVYFDGMDNDMWLASRSGSSWTTQRLAGETGAVGFHNEVAVIGDTVWAGSYDYSANTLHLQAL